MAYDRSKDPAPHDAKPWMMLPHESAAVTPSDSEDFSGTYPVGLFIKTAGTVSFIPARNADGAYITTESLPAGHTIYMVVRRVRATGTTATLDALHL